MEFYLDQCALQQYLEEGKDGNLTNAVAVDLLGLTQPRWVGYFRTVLFDSRGEESCQLIFKT